MTTEPDTQDAPQTVRQLRVVLRVDDIDAALALYRDALGLTEQAAFEGDGDARVVILRAGEATLELANPAQVAMIDRVETDGGTSDPVRIAFEVDDAASATDRLAAAGATVEATPRETPWRSRNARLRDTAGTHVTLFEELESLADREQRPGFGIYRAPQPASQRRHIGHVLRSLDSAIEASFEDALGSMSITRRQWQVLRTVHGEGASAAAIEQALRPFDESGEEVAAAIADLDGRGWLEHGDQLRLSPAGALAFDEALHHVTRVRERIRASVSEREYAATIDTLQRVLLALSDEPAM